VTKPEANIRGIIETTRKIVEDSDGRVDVTRKIVEDSDGRIRVTRRIIADSVGSIRAARKSIEDSREILAKLQAESDLTDSDENV
jgi:hypothetical protein